VSRYRRWNELLELLGSRGQLQVEDAAKALNVSAATIRRDFDELAGQQMLTRIRGGAVAEGVNYDLPLRYKTERHPSEKHRIGALAAGMVRTGQAVGAPQRAQADSSGASPAVPRARSSRARSRALVARPRDSRSKNSASSANRSSAGSEGRDSSCASSLVTVSSSLRPS